MFLLHFSLSAIGSAVQNWGRSPFSLCGCVSVISVCCPLGMGGWEEAGMEREATKGCKLIRFLSLHAPLPVLFLSNPGGQCCAAQRLNSQTQWGNNCYMQHLAAETLSVIPNDTFLFLLSQLSLSQGAVSLIQKLFIHCSVSFFIPSFCQRIFTFWH